MGKTGELQVCPKCLGTRIDLYLGGSAGKLYRCLDCGYVGPVVIVTTIESYASLAKEFESDERKRVQGENP
ncbi:MAG: hypothetical protein JTT11_09790 [Candidatus Brockarchaeota archaeon]|nr:hypothetical protein [Candidatus Brockarchaeota archaeon]